MTSLNQQPSPTELSPEFTPEMRAGLNEAIGHARGLGLSDAAIAQELGLGMSSQGGMWISRATLKDYLIKQGKGLMAAPAIGALIVGLNAAHDGLGDMASLGMVMGDVISTGDPLGLIAVAMTKYFDLQAKDRQKQIDNDTPDKDYGTKMGYVREGDTWYPAIFNQRYQSTGLLASGQQITIDYGHDIVYRMDGEGRFIPMIPNAKSKNFVASDHEWEGKTKFGGHVMSGKDFVTTNVFKDNQDPKHPKMYDTTRDWYFLSPEEMSEVAKGEKHLEAYTDDVENMTSSARQLNDWRKALDFSQDWKWSTAAQTMGPGAGINNYAGSRGLQRQMYEGLDHMSGGIWNTGAGDTTANQSYEDYIRDYANHTGETWKSGHGAHHQMGSYLFDTVLHDHIMALYRTQEIAAAEAGFDKLYDSEIGRAVEGNDPDRTNDAAGGTPWASMYLDTAKDMPTAASAEELSKQLHDIEMLTDRSPAQRNYLAQKVQTRYWMQQVVTIGQASKLQSFIAGDKDITRAQTLYQKYTWNEDKKRSADDVIKRWNSGFDYMSDANRFDKGFAMPWMNAGESYLPNLTGALAGTTVKDYMGSSDQATYDRRTAEAVQFTNDWIKRTGKLDPNLKIQGVDYKLGETGFLSKEHARSLDEYTGQMVAPGENSKWTKYDVETGTYKLTPEGETRLANERAFLKRVDKGEITLDENEREEVEEIRRRHEQEFMSDDEAASLVQAELDYNDAMRRLLRQRSMGINIDAQVEALKRKYGKIDEPVEVDDPVDDPVVEADDEAADEADDEEDPIEAWRQQGIRLGLLDESWTKPTQPTEHQPMFSPDPVAPTHIFHAEHYNLPAMSSTLMQAVHAAESMVKVV
jgi:hypothetical protein